MTQQEKDDKRAEEDALDWSILKDENDHVSEMNRSLRLGDWDKVLDDNCSTLSMITSGALAQVAQVPGSCEMGKMGLWFAHKMYREYVTLRALYK